jgi:hypothetical protein
VVVELHEVEVHVFYSIILQDILVANQLRQIQVLRQSYVLAIIQSTRVSVDSQQPHHASTLTQVEGLLVGAQTVVAQRLCIQNGSLIFVQEGIGPIAAH